MLRYFLKRVLLVIPIIMAVILIVYALLYTTVGANRRALSSYGGGDLLDRAFDRLEIQETFFSRYLRYCCNVIFHLNFGADRASGRSMGDTILWRLSFTLRLSGWAFLVATVLGILLGMLAAIHKDSALDNALMGVIGFCSSVPSYPVALLLVLFFSLKLRILPAFGFTRPGSLIMPVASLSLGGIASTARITRASAIEILEQPYITALRAKGLRERRIVYLHALRNALLPVIANLGLVLSQLLCGSMVVERFFSLPGIGLAMLTAVSGRDQLTVMGIAVAIAVMLTLVNVGADLLYALVNPQIRNQYRGKEGDEA